MTPPRYQDYAPAEIPETTLPGGIVVKGKLVRAGTLARLKRGAEVIHTGKLASLKRFKDDVREVTEGTECGASLEGYSDYQVGDVIEVYQVEEIARTL